MLGDDATEPNMAVKLSARSLRPALCAVSP